ncbi:MAG: RrF2 family transcriptional regulator [Rhodospirillales bacterium]
MRGEYALQAVFALAAHASGEPMKIAEISKGQKIPQKFLELILASLKQGGFVESRRGAEGGYMLARPAETITVGEVLRYIEGSHAARTRTAKRKAETPFTELWRSVDDAVSRIIDQTTFAELVRRWAERQSRYVPNWEI